MLYKPAHGKEVVIVIRQSLFKPIFHLSFDISHLSLMARLLDRHQRRIKLDRFEMTNDKCQMTNGKSSYPNVLRVVASPRPDGPPPPPPPDRKARNALLLHPRDRKAGSLPRCNAASGADNAARSDNPAVGQSGWAPSPQSFPGVPSSPLWRWLAWERIATGPRCRDVSAAQTILQPATPRQFCRCTSPRPGQRLQPLHQGRE